MGLSIWVILQAKTMKNNLPLRFILMSILSIVYLSQCVIGIESPLHPSNQLNPPFTAIAPGEADIQYDHATKDPMSDSEMETPTTTPTRIPTSTSTPENGGTLPSIVPTLPTSLLTNTPRPSPTSFETLALTYEVAQLTCTSDNLVRVKISLQAAGGAHPYHYEPYHIFHQEYPTGVEYPVDVRVSSGADQVALRIILPSHICPEP